MSGLMTSLDRLRVEKAAADCGFEMTPVAELDGLALRSARFPEVLFVRRTGEQGYEVSATDPALLNLATGTAAAVVEGVGALYAVLRAAAGLARTKPNRVAEEFKKRIAALPSSTEVERLVIQRVGQSMFRSALLDYWQGRCCVTELGVPELLRASHIRPWASCETDEQRLDVFNGLLLAPHIDALFDGGWISFSDEGAILISPALHHDALLRLGLTTNVVIPNLRAEHRPYLQFHREQRLRLNC